MTVYEGNTPISKAIASRDRCMELRPASVSFTGVTALAETEAGVDLIRKPKISHL